MKHSCPKCCRSNSSVWLACAEGPFTCCFLFFYIHAIFGITKNSTCLTRAGWTNDFCLNLTLLIWGHGTNVSLCWDTFIHQFAKPRSHLVTGYKSKWTRTMGGVELRAATATLCVVVSVTSHTINDGFTLSLVNSVLQGQPDYYIHRPITSSLYTWYIVHGRVSSVF